MKSGSTGGVQFHIARSYSRYWLSGAVIASHAASESIFRCSAWMPICSQPRWMVWKARSPEPLSSVGKMTSYFIGTPSATRTPSPPLA